MGSGSLSGHLTKRAYWIITLARFYSKFWVTLLKYFDQIFFAL